MIQKSNPRYPKLDKCVVCGAANPVWVNEIRTFTAPFGPEVKYESPYYHCDTCKEDISDGDEGFVNAIKQSEAESISLMLSKLKESRSLEGIELRLGLEEGTFEQWEKDAEKRPREALALLRMISAYPWLIDVADSHYDQKVLKRNLIAEGLDTLHKIAEESKVI